MDKPLTIIDATPECINVSDDVTMSEIVNEIETSVPATNMNTIINISSDSDEFLSNVDIQGIIDNSCSSKTSQRKDQQPVINISSDSDSFLSNIDIKGIMDTSQNESPQPASKKQKPATDIKLTNNNISSDSDDEFFSHIDIQKIVETDKSIKKKTIINSSATLDGHVDFTEQACSSNQSNQIQNHVYKHSAKVMDVLHNVFKLKSFRTNQLEAINAAILKHDCLIVMPTGGGKSLCYQIPALVDEGLTIVVSPLISLIVDQVQTLKSLNIQASYLIGKGSNGQNQKVFQDLSVPSNIKILYVTPEMVVNSQRLNKVLVELYSRQKLARFVIDEAHCILEWGNAFRKHYLDLKFLRKRFSLVPIMALTASATETAQIDIVHQLCFKNAKTFTTSFDRTNIKYSVLPKDNSVMDKLVTLIHTKFSKSCGIVYCLSREECKKTAETLSAKGIMSLPYHAGISNKVRESTQNAWMNDKIKVIVATVAFGMGIDKHNVRFVVHLTMAKSYENFYQETGRAGRDGNIAHAITFYRFADCTRWKGLFENKNKNEDMKKLHEMVEFLEEKIQCRRKLLMDHFGEEHDGCILSHCDNCEAKGQYSEVDATEEAKAIVHSIPILCKSGNLTMGHLLSVVKGSRMSTVVNAGHDRLAVHGIIKFWDNSTAERLLHKLVTNNFIGEQLIVTPYKSTISYLLPGPNASKIDENAFKMMLARRHVAATATSSQKRKRSE